MLTDQYKDKVLRFYEVENHYELHICGDFHGISDSEEGSEKVDLIQFSRDVAAADKSKELFVFINSYGGFVDSLIIILAEIKKFNHVVTICTSSAASCGFLLWMAGDERYVSRYAMLVYHEPSFGIGSKIEEVATMTNSVREQYKILYDDIGIGNFLSPEELEKGKTTEVYISGEEMMSRHLAYSYDLLEKRENIPILGFRLLGNYILIEDIDDTYRILNFKNIISNEFKKAAKIDYKSMVMINNEANFKELDVNDIIHKYISSMSTQTKSPIKKSKKVKKPEKKIKKNNAEKE